MPDLYKLSDLKDSACWWIPGMRRADYIIYWLVILLFLTGFISLFFIHVDISVRGTGIIRPFFERTEIKSPVSGIIDSIYFKEGDTVSKNNLLLKLHDPALIEKQRLNEMEILQCRDFIHDLDLLTSAAGASVKIIPSLKSQLYKEETWRFLSRTDEQENMLSKASHETMLNEKLAKDNVISPKEFYDIRMQEQRMISQNESFRREQFANWQTDLIKYKTELKQCLSSQEEFSQLYEMNQIHAPVSGSVQELNKRYMGTAVQAGELICSISPNGVLIGDCYVLSKDIGLLKTGQPAKFRIDALNYNYFGLVSGNIFSIDNDFVLLDKLPVFKVRCRLNQSRLKLSNGFTGVLKKGMSFQVRFITCKRSLWQLLYDSVDDWLNPAGQQNIKVP